MISLPLPGETAAAIEDEHARVGRRVARAAALARGSLLADEVVAQLGVPLALIETRLERGELLGVRILGPGWWLPAWQFDPSSPDGLVRGIREVAMAYPGTINVLSGWIVAPLAALGGRSPREALIAGELDAVLALVEAVAERQLEA